MMLNDAQERALGEILDAQADGRSMHVLTGNAGTGKTFLMQAVVKALKERRQRVVVTAPTHKAVQVIASKLASSGIEADAMTIHSLLGLAPTPDGEKTKLRRKGGDKSSAYTVVIVDECSMLGEELMKFIRSTLTYHFVLFVGDPAQLSPVGEEKSPTFSVSSKSHLSTIVRQAEGNPIIAAAQYIRDCQDTGVTGWGWTEPVQAGEFGIYHVDDPDAWLRYEFTSDEFRENNDTVRYLCYTNDRVAQINAKIRQWIYGYTPTPFVPGERVICRTPIMRDGLLVYSTNEEVTVHAIEEGVETFRFPAMAASGPGQAPLHSWAFDLQVWRVVLGDNEVPAIIPRHPRQYDQMMEKLRQEALQNRGRWFERFQVAEKVSKLQCLYAMTSHTSQGSTFGRVFVDMDDVRKCGIWDSQEMLRMFYVDVTRPTHAVALIGGIPRA